MNRNYEAECGISIIGGIVLDLVTSIEKLRIEPSGWQLSDCYTLDPGNIFTTALTIKNLGAPVSILGWVGKDYFGDIAISHIIKEGFDVSRIIKEASSTTMVLAITDSNGNHSRIVLPGKNNLYSLPDSWRATLQSSSIIYLSGFSCVELAEDIILDIIKISKKNQIPLVFDPQTAISKIEPSLLEKVLKATWLLTLNWDESMVLERMGIFALNEKGGKLIPRTFIRKGKEGVRLINSLETKDFPAITITAKNTLGAGDCFNGSILFGLYKGLSDSSIATLGNITAGIKASKFGTSSGVPTIFEVRDYLEKSGDQRLLSLLDMGI